MNLCWALLIATTASSASPQWIDDYGQALQAARATQRPLLIVLDEPAPAAKQTKRISTARDASQDELLSRYTLCRVDVSTRYGGKVAEAFQAREFPHTVVIDKTASVILAQRTGALSQEEWQSLLVTYQDGRRPPVSPPRVSRRSASWQPFRAGRANCFT